MTDSHEITKAAPAQITYIERPADIHPLVTMMQSSGEKPTMDMLAKWMDLQERYEAREAEKAYTKAMAIVKPLLPVVIDHDSEVKYGTTDFTYASLPAVMKDVVPVLSEHGFVLKWIPSTPSPQMVTVECRITHADGHKDSCVISAPPDSKGGKNAAQAIASTIKLLERYTAQALLGITDKNIDENIQIRDESEDIDTELNLKALASLSRIGITQIEAEHHVQCAMENWTKKDIESLRELKAMRISHAAQAREPGQEG